jgi:type IV secretion system protein VirB5
MQKPTKRPAPAESPYLTARREWNERYGDYIKAANNWRLIAIGCVLVALVAVAGLANLAGQQKIIPYVVQYDANGELIRVGKADVASNPTDRQMVAALRNWVIGVRTVYVDAQAQEAVTDLAYAMTQPGSACHQTLIEYHREHNPYVRAQQETVEVTVNAVVPISGQTWQIDWTEATKQRSGKLLSTKQYQGSITVVVAPPNDELQIMLNPLGIYAQQCAWTTRL